MIQRDTAVTHESVIGNRGTGARMDVSAWLAATTQDQAATPMEISPDDTDPGMDSKYALYMVQFLAMDFPFTFACPPNLVLIWCCWSHVRPSTVGMLQSVPVEPAVDRVNVNDDNCVTHDVICHCCCGSSMHIQCTTSFAPF